MGATFPRKRRVGLAGLGAWAGLAKGRVKTLGRVGQGRRVPHTHMDTAEASVRAAAQVYIARTSIAHPQCRSLDVTPGSLDVTPGSDTPMTAGKIVSVLVLHAGNTAVAHVQWADRAGWLTLLLEHGEWIVISSITSSTVGTATPADMAAAVEACWVEYCGANRQCDGARMAQVFHPQCRLTYTGPDGALVIKSQEAFVQMVSERYSMPMHAPYAHLRDDPRVAARDNLLSASFATPDVCMVVLKVGHPPMLWTDVLTCARLGDKWWIVAKSSCSEPLLKDEAK